MTVITYSSTAGRHPEEIQVLDRPDTSRNVPESPSGSREPLNPPEDLMLESCGVKGQSWAEEKEEQKTKAGVKRGNLQSGSQTWGRGVQKERIKKGEREDRRVIRKKSKGSGTNGIKEKDMSESDVSGILSAAEMEGGDRAMGENEEGKKELACLSVYVPPEKDYRRKGEQRETCPGDEAVAYLPLVPSPPPQPESETCFITERSSYCQFPSSQTELLTCYQAFCIQECPYRSSTPPYALLLLPAHRHPCVSEDREDTRPGTQTETGTTPDSESFSRGSSSLLFQPVQNGCLVSPPSQKVGVMGSLTLALWIKTSSPGEMMLLEKSVGERLLFSVTVSEQAVTLRYVQSRGQTTMTVSFRTEGRLALERWTHLVLQFFSFSQ
ncbi:unnamed protein product [Pleuronectes platessa]|uniref:Uncharacterized protein n=1 Tax=Pleuronectes platessa TaxID=8262 RepID=A0A9N7V6G8_PLEPL|nr:unnamed protein product [Pleuronectes platessa]